MKANHNSNADNERRKGGKMERGREREREKANYRVNGTTA